MPMSNPFRRPKKQKAPQPSLTSNQSEPEPEPAKPLLFRVQLAHGSPTATIHGFSNVRELYEKIAAALGISVNEIIFCTLNTHKCDMEKLLGAQIGLDDFIFCHVKGDVKKVNLIKSEPAIGLTITDNGTGIAFLKRIRENSIAQRSEVLHAGDHIAAINKQSTVGLRHYQVAKMLKDVPIGYPIELDFVEPKKAFDMISQRSKPKGQVAESNVGSGKSTLRLRSQGPATLEAVPTESEDKAVRKIDDLLDSFLGIRDMELSSTIWESGKNKKNPDEFVSALNDQLGEFGFPQEFLFDVWGVILDAGLRKQDTF